MPLLERRVEAPARPLPRLEPDALDALRTQLAAPTSAPWWASTIGMIHLLSSSSGALLAAPLQPGADLDLMRAHPLRLAVTPRVPLDSVDKYAERYTIVHASGSVTADTQVPRGRLLSLRADVGTQAHALASVDLDLLLVAPRRSRDTGSEIAGITDPRTPGQTLSLELTPALVDALHRLLGESNALFIDDELAPIGHLPRAVVSPRALAVVVWSMLARAGLAAAHNGLSVTFDRPALACHRLDLLLRVDDGLLAFRACLDDGTGVVVDGTLVHPPSLQGTEDVAAQRRISFAPRREIVVLRPLHPDHVDHIMTWVNDKEIVGNLATFHPGRPFTRDDELAYVHKMIASHEDRVFSIFSTGADGTPAGRYLGQCGLHQIFRRSGVGRCSMIISERDLMGRGYGSAALAHLLDVAFRARDAGGEGLHKVWLMVFSTNTRSRRTYERVGFEQEGLLRDEYFHEGSWHDMVRMAVLAPDWSSTT